MVEISDYAIRVEVKPGLANKLLGTRYWVSVTRAGRFVSGDYALSEGRVHATGVRLVLGDLANRLVAEWDWRMKVGGRR